MIKFIISLLQKLQTWLEAHHDQTTVAEEVKTDAPKPETPVLPSSGTSANPPWLDLAYKELGVSETKNPARVIEYHKATTLPKSLQVPATPWCASFVSYILKNAGLLNQGSAAAIDFLKVGVHIDEPRLGCLCVYKRPGGHHVHFYLRENQLGIYGLGGNQGDSVSEQWYLKSNLLGYRWPGKDVKS